MSKIQNEILAKALRQVRTGKIPPTEPQQEFGGPGENTPCDICGEPILTRDIEIEAVYPEAGSFFFHVSCMTALRAACAEINAQR